jgi:hypothetical protein
VYMRKEVMQYAYMSILDVVLTSGDEFIGSEIRQAGTLSIVEIRLAYSIQSDIM